MATKKNKKAKAVKKTTKKVVKHPNVHRITVKQKSSGFDAGGPTSGANTTLLLDGKPLKGVTGVHMKLDASAFAVVTIVMLAKADIDVDARAENVVVDNKPLVPEEDLPQESNVLPLTADSNG